MESVLGESVGDVEVLLSQSTNFSQSKSKEKVKILSAYGDRRCSRVVTFFTDSSQTMPMHGTSNLDVS